MRHLHCFLVLFIFLSANILLAQDTPIKKSSYNLPPGAVLKQKISPIDLSFKLTGKVSAAQYDESDLNILKELSAHELSELKNTDTAYYNYYQEGLAYINSLSVNVKKIYSEKELWYIYVFDQKLKDKLTTIK